MKIKITVRDTSSRTEWTETYDRVGIGDNGNLQQAEDWALQLIKHFNETLHPGESRREVVRTEIAGVSTAHDWYKRTDGMSARIGGRIVDVFECSKCGITGKRAGLSSIVKRDSKYRAKKFAVCGTRGIAHET